MVSFLHTTCWVRLSVCLRKCCYRTQNNCYCCFLCSSSTSREFYNKLRADSIEFHRGILFPTCDSKFLRFPGNCLHIIRPSIRNFNELSFGHSDTLTFPSSKMWQETGWPFSASFDKRRYLISYLALGKLIRVLQAHKIRESCNGKFLPLKVIGEKNSRNWEKILQARKRKLLHV